MKTEDLHEEDYRTFAYVERFDDLDMAWLYHAQGWAKVKWMMGHHGYWSWLAVK